MHDWFTVTKIDDITYAISENRHWEETNSYLLLGKSRALLIDAGIGVCDMGEIVRGLTSLPVLAVATHIHWDHTGSLGSFDTIAVHEDEIGWLREFPQPLAVVRRNLQVGYHDFPVGFDPEAYTPFSGEADVILHDNDIIDLGGRSVRVIHTPGHSPGHMCFFEVESGYLYTGDLLYKGTLYAFYPTTDPCAFRDSINKICALSPKRLLPAHHDIDIPLSYLDIAREGFMAIEKADKLHHGGGTFDFGDIKIQV